MNNIFVKILIAIIFMAQSALVCSAQVITKKDIVPVVEKSISQDLKSKGFKNIEVNIVSVPFIQLSVPDGKITYKVSSNSKTVTSRCFMIVSIYSNGDFVRTVGIPVKISALKDVYVAKENIGRGAVLTANILQVKTMDITNTYITPLEYGDLTKSYVTTKIFPAGAVIDKKHLKSQPDIMRDAAVTVYFSTKKNIAVTLDCIAVSEGNIGDVISVKNKKYNRIYNGKIIGENKVLVRI